MVPDVAPEDGVQPELQFEPPHVRVASVSALYLPASQFVQIVEAVAAEYLPASQFSQAADPDVALNLPATQDEQSPSGPVKPALH